MLRITCEECPYINFPLDDVDVWEEIAAAQRAATPEYSDETNAHATNVERQMRAGMEAHMEQCPGFSIWRALGNRILYGSGKFVETSGGIRVVKWAEITCNNPFLQTEEYALLAAQMTRQFANDYEKRLTDTTDGV